MNNLANSLEPSEDQFSGEEFDFMLSNPPFGTSWKTDLKAWGDIKKEEISDPRFIINYDDNAEYSLLPDIGDPQMLFLANNISKMNSSTELGSRIVKVHNGSSLFTGIAGSGPSNLRRYIIEKDLLEAIVALPENMFYNTGIGTYLWIVTNKKADSRKGKVQLIDATSLKSPLRKNLGDKNCELTAEICQKILGFLMDYTEADKEYSRVFDNDEFGYYSVDVLRPLRLRVDITEERLFMFKEQTKEDELYAVLVAYIDETASKTFYDYNEFIKILKEDSGNAGVKLNAKRLKYIREYFSEVDEKAKPVIDKNGNLESDKNLKDTEQIPFLCEGGINAFYENEIKPYVPDAWIDYQSVVKGYELSFTKYFYKPVKMRDVQDIINDMKEIEKSTDGLLASIIGEIV